MVLAHEIAHVRLRHPATSMGRGMAVSLGVSVVSAGLGDGLASQALGSAGLLTELNFSREQELDADAAGLASLNALYGHVHGADVLFQRMADLLVADEFRVPAFFSTHPLDEERIYAIADLAARNRWSIEGELTPFPEAIRIQFPSMASDDGEAGPLSVDDEEEDADEGEDGPTSEGDSSDGVQ
jgi:predicted Zn-dependent protease